jgi:hypothetical protein
MLLTILAPSEVAAQTETLRWILATTSQGSAAFVAIIAGFQLSRILTISSTRQSLQARRTFLNREIAILDDEQAYLEEKIDAKNRKSFAKLYLDEIVQVRGNREEIWNFWTETEPDQMPDFLETSHFCKSVAQAFEAFQERFPGEEDVPEIDFNDKDNQVLSPLREHGVLDAVRNFLNLERAKIRKERAASAQTSQPGLLNQINSMFGNYQGLISDATSGVHIPKLDFELPDQEHSANVRRFKEQDALLVAKMEELEHLDLEIARLKSSKGHKSAFALIAVFGLLGVIAPLVLSIFTFDQPRTVAIGVIVVFAGLFTFMVLFMFAQLKMVKGARPSKNEQGTNLGNKGEIK